MIACHSCGGMFPSAPALIEHACPNGHCGRPGRRGELYRLLRCAGEVGLSHRDLGEAGIACAMVHVESLRFEGHAILRFDGRDERDLPVARIVLTKDAWAEDVAA